MSLSQDQATRLLQQISLQDANLYAILRLLLADVTALNGEVFPENPADIPAVANEPVPDSVTTFTYTLTELVVRLNWTIDPSSNARMFEIRSGNGAWDAAPFVVRTPSFQADLNPIAVGTSYYQIKTLNSENEYSVASTTVAVVVPSVNPPSSFIPTVIDNNVLLSWTQGSPIFKTDHYNIYKDGVLIGTTTGNFVVRFETISGIYEYGVEQVDIAGNVSSRTLANANVNQPPDFELFSDMISALGGTKTNVLLQTGPNLLCCVNLTETWEDHFLVGAHAGKPWADPNEQVTNNYPIYIEPAKTTGSYVETVDYGAIINNVIVNISYTFEVVSGSFGITVGMEVSDDNITYTAITTGDSQFFASVRYLRLTITFVPADDKSLGIFSNLHIVLDVKREVDSNTVTANAGDIGGTTVTFGKAFKDVDSITTTAKTTEPIEVVVDFTDVPNPTTFKVYAFNSLGQRVTIDVYWKARGVV
jgi:hypothetical protein